MDFACAQIKADTFERDDARKCFRDVLCLKHDRIHVQFLRAQSTWLLCLGQAAIDFRGFVKAVFHDGVHHVFLRDHHDIEQD